MEVSPIRPIARLVVDALSGRSAQRSSRVGPYVPPVVRAGSSGDASAPGARSAPTITTHCESLLWAILTGERVDGLERWVAPDVVVWSPVRYAPNRADFLAGLRNASDDVGDTLTDVAVEATNVDVALPRVHLEWRLTARFSHPCFIDDDLLVEPTERLVETGGALVVTASEGMIVAAHCYYDDFALLEQLVSIA